MGGSHLAAVLGEGKGMARVQALRQEGACWSSRQASVEERSDCWRPRALGLVSSFEAELAAMGDREEGI